MNAAPPVSAPPRSATPVWSTKIDLPMMPRIAAPQPAMSDAISQTLPRSGTSRQVSTAPHTAATPTSTPSMIASNSVREVGCGTPKSARTVSATACTTASTPPRNSQVRGVVRIATA